MLTTSADPNRPKQAPGRLREEEFVPAIAVSAERAYRLLGIGRDMGSRLIKERVIPSVRLGRRILVPVDELKKMLAEMIEVDRLCRTCTKRIDVKGNKNKCSVFASPPADASKCPAWSFDEAWRLKEWKQRLEYEEKKGGGKR